MNSILLVLPVPFRLVGGTLHIESQAANGLDRWAENFGQVVAACPLLPERDVGKRASWNWVPAHTLLHARRIRLVPLPWARSIGPFLHDLPATRRLLAEEIRRCEYLQFAIGGLVGDWPSVAAIEARRQGRPYAVWTDRVESAVVRITAAGKPPAGKAWSLLHASLLGRYERHIIRRARLGLFHGADTFRSYAGLARHAFLTHDVHTKVEDLIGADATDAKASAVLEPQLALRIGYAGRATAMKAPLEWLSILLRLKRMGVAYEAAWLGDGELLGDMQRFIEDNGLSGCVKLLGFVSDRAEVLAFLRSCHVLLFTHITPESPRIIPEALLSATPVVGYGSPYVEEIVAEADRRLLGPMGDTEQIARILAGLSGDRPSLSAAIARARTVGGHFNDTALFRHRAGLIKQYL